MIEAINRYQSVAIFTTYNRALIKEANVILEINSNSSFIFRGNLEEFEEKMHY